MKRKMLIYLVALLAVTLVGCRVDTAAEKQSYEPSQVTDTQEILAQGSANKDTDASVNKITNEGDAHEPEAYKPAIKYMYAIVSEKNKNAPIGAQSELSTVLRSSSIL